MQIKEVLLKFLLDGEGSASVEEPQVRSILSVTKRNPNPFLLSLVLCEVKSRFLVVGDQGFLKRQKGTFACSFQALVHLNSDPTANNCLKEKTPNLERIEACSAISQRFCSWRLWA